VKIRIATLFPRHLDLNGDQANLKIIQKRLEWFGHESEIIAVSKGESIPEAVSLIFLGHGSIAAWADIDGELSKLVPALKAAIDSGVAFMAVATGQERAIQFGLLPGEIIATERVSKFEIAEIDGQEILGYLNSASSAPVIQKYGLVLGTQLHGPVFAKNPEFVDAYLEQILESKGLSLHAVSPADYSTGKNNADLVAGIVKQVWELERELASE